MIRPSTVRAPIKRASTSKLLPGPARAGVLVVALAGLVLVSAPTAATASTEARSPAQAVYDEVSVYRDRHAEVIWDGAEADPDMLRVVARDLDRGLALLDEPLHVDLAEGSIQLHYRRYNLLLDKVKVHARLGERDAALDALEAMQRIGWHPGAIDRLMQDPHVAALEGHPRLAVARAREGVATRLAAAPALATGFKPSLSAGERIAGLSMIWSAAREGFVWFDQVPDLDWDQAYLDFIPQVLAEADTERYYRVLMRFSALLGDGHSNVSPPQALVPRFFARPPLRTALLGGDVVVMRIDSPVLTALGLEIGDRVLSIDGRDVHVYVRDEVAPFTGASTPQDREVRVYDTRLLTGPAEQAVVIEVEKADGERRRVELRRDGYGRIEPPPSETLELRADGIAVLGARQFGSDAALKLFEANLDAIMDARGLVIDLRGNGGGSTNYGWDILTWLSAVPLTGTASRHRVGNALERARSAADTPLRWRTLGDEPYRRERPRVFTGPVAILIDARTYSAAEDTAAAFRLMERGPIIGVASGGSTGQPLFLELPGGGHARVCVKRDAWPDGSDFVGVGVLPDIEVRTTIEDVRARRDPVLERALAYLSESNRGER